MKILFCFSVLLISVLAHHSQNYEDHILLSVTPSNNEEKKAVVDFIESGKADHWGHGNDGGEHLFVQSQNAKLLEERVKNSKILKTGKQITEMVESSSPHRNAGESKAVDWTGYNTLDEINDYLDEVAANNSAVASVSVLGQTYEGRDMKMITLSNVPDSPDRPLFVLDAGIHAREWVAPATATYFIDQLLSDPLLDNMTVAIIPSLNPDGYQYSWDSERLWRKTRSPSAGSSCVGVDENRNYDFHWNEIGSSTNPCSNTYCGPSPCSEVECQAMSAYVNAQRPRIKAYITLHSYSQLFMYAYGYTPDPHWNQPELDRVGKLATDAIRAVHGMDYEYGSANLILYGSSGSSRDYMAGAMNISYVYTIELRDTGEYGFLLPEAQILPTAEETYAGFRVVADEALAAN